MFQHLHWHCSNAVCHITTTLHGNLWLTVTPAWGHVYETCQLLSKQMFQNILSLSLPFLASHSIMVNFPCDGQGCIFESLPVHSTSNQSKMDNVYQRLIAALNSDTQVSLHALLSSCSSSSSSLSVSRTNSSWHPTADQRQQYGSRHNQGFEAENESTVERWARAWTPKLARETSMQVGVVGEQCDGMPVFSWYLGESNNIFKVLGSMICKLHVCYGTFFGETVRSPLIKNLDKLNGSYREMIMVQEV